ncbi:hypothetical protein K2173_007961 [Erythroxylum novogranatense]|uniref:ZCF37 n=1 Tax=Erythroxylum novogranatense TaxID=1862640 RepID=A0AAV8T6W5_9ROSI|nr:hypothetical protein K2173_007961 [Erythroxylum novogranatense]
MSSDPMLNPLSCTNPKKTKDFKKCKSHSLKPIRSRKNSANPFSDRGLDKFEELLADLEKKKKMIYSKVGPEDVYYVRFKYSPTNDIVPVVVKLKDPDDKKEKVIEVVDSKEDKKDSDKLDAHDTTEVLDKSPRKGSSTPDKKIEKKRSSWNLMLHKWRRPSFYMPMIVIFILLLLIFFGRSVVILCTSLGWYVVPTLSSKKPIKKKINKRGFSEPKMVSDGLSSPKLSKIHETMKLKSEQQKSFS